MQMLLPRAITSAALACTLARLLSPSIATAQEPPVARLVAGKPYDEHVRKHPPVSGGDILGVVIGEGAAATGAESIFVRTPAKWAGGHVCVEVASRDGIYVAANTFDVPAAPAGSFVKLAFSSQHADLYSAATPDTFAARAAIGDCGDTDNRLLPLAWSSAAGAAAGSRLVMSVQSGQTKASVVVSPDDRHERCRRLQGPGPSLTAFDSVCEMPLPSSDVKVFVERCSFGSCTRAPIVTLAL